MKNLRKLLVILGLAMLGYIPQSWAGNCHSVSWAGHENWSDPSNWDCNGINPRVPDSGDDVEITQDSPIILNQNATVKSITINNGGVLKTDNSNRVLTLTTSTAFTVLTGGSFTPGNSTVVITREGNTTLTAGAVTFNNLQLSPTVGNNRTYTFGSGAVTVNGDLTINPTNSSSQSRTLTVNMGGALTVKGTTTIQGSGGSMTSVLNTVSSSNSLTLGTVVIASTGTLTTNGSTVAITGNFTNNGTFTTPTGTTTFSGTSPQTIGGTTATTFNNLTVNNSSGVTLNSSPTVSGTLTLSSGALNVASNTLTLNGPAIAGTTSNLATTSASSLVFGGSSAGVSIPGSVMALGKLTVNNANGISLNNDLAINTSLTMTNGKITTGSRILGVTPACNGSAITQTSGYVQGNLRLTYPSGTNVTCVFHVGSGTTYAPVNLTVTSGGGTLTGSTTGSEHPQIATSEIDSTKDVNRYWTLGKTGDTLVVSTYSATFTFVSADQDSSASTSGFVVGSYSGGTWTLPTPVTTSSTSTTVTGITGDIVKPTDFAVGETSGPACTVPSDLSSVSNLTCVCDNFGRTSLNPSTINGGNWTVSHSSGTFGDPRIINNGYLRLTDNSTNVATVATLPGTFPAAGNLISIEFKHYAYKGTIAGGGPTAGADGIAVTLSDATITPQAGAYGGSLGYAQKTGINGFAGGWLGVGIDEFGNYSNSGEGRGTGVGTSLIKDAIAARGSGSGSASGQYPYLDGTGASVSPGVDDPTSTTAAPGHAYRILVDARNYSDSNKQTQVGIYRDTSGAGNFSSSLLNFDVYQKNPSQAVVPANWKISLTGSTGSLVNIHEISGFKVCATLISLPPIITVDDYSPSTCNSISKGKPTVTITATKTNGTVDTSYNKTVTLAAKLADGSTSNAVFTLLSGTAANWNSASKTYTFSAADQGVVKFTLTDTTQQDVYVSLTESGTGLVASLSSPIQFKGTSFTIGISDALNTEVVAGRPHLMTITRNSGCGVDTTGYNGTKNLDGWYTPDISHPTGAGAPKVCATNASGTCFATDGTGVASMGTCTELSTAQPTVSSAINNLPVLTFSSGVAKFCLATSDVGKYTLNVRDDVTSTISPIVATSQTLTARPFAIVVSDVTGNPAGSGSSDAVFTKAGQSFSATIGGYLWSSNASTAAGVAVPAVGKTAMTAGGLAPKYADTITLSATTPILPAGGVTGTFSNGNVLITAGGTTVNNLSYSEVGSISLAAAPSTNYLNSGINLTGKVAIYAKSGSNTLSSVLGRFIPNHFAVSAATIVPRSDISTCGSSSFTYMGEPMKLSFILTARNAANVLTQNYKGAYAKLALSPASAFSFGAINDTTDLGTRLDTSMTTTVTSGGWDNGTAEMTSVPIALSRPSSESVLATQGGPYANFKLGIAPVDSDGVSMLPADLALVIPGGNKAQLGSAQQIRLGRLRLSNAHGSELLKLLLPLEAQYWNGAGFVTNLEDDCTAIAGSSFVTSSYRNNLAACETKLPVAVTMTDGKVNVVMTAPGAGNNGSVDLSLNLGAAASGATCTTDSTTTATSENKVYLQGNWTGTGFTDNPGARATFGVFKSGPVIYIREIH